MSANRIFLVCSHHPQLENALCLGERADANNVYEPGGLKRITEWFERHKGCGNPDDFQLAFSKTPNWDCPTIATKTASAVRLAVANGSAHEES